jgi:hypothetical protein
LIAALTYSDKKVAKAATNLLKKEYGELDLVSSAFSFNHSQYYADEMGSALDKRFISFKNPNSIDCFIEFKLLSLKLENNFAVEGRRRVNIDPGYLESAKLVLASTKNYDHRIYLGKGIYGDVQLRFREGQFVDNPWTYPDYLTETAQTFFKKTRTIYFSQLKDIL